MAARILVIEDNPNNLELAIYLLHAFGHEAMAAHDGPEGLETASRERPDLILCDIQMPGMDGYEVASQLGALPEPLGTPLVAITAMAMLGDRERVLAAGFVGYIAKPIDPEAFRAQVDAFLPAELRSVPPDGGTPRGP